MIENLHSAFDHKALEPSNACLDKGDKVFLQVIQRSSANAGTLGYRIYLVVGDNPTPKADVCPTLASGGIPFNREILHGRCRGDRIQWHIHYGGHTTR